MSRHMRQAVALAYGKHLVPVVTAKGDNDLAMRMLEEARQQGVFISEDPQLLALLSRLDVDQEIPQELYLSPIPSLRCRRIERCSLTWLPEPYKKTVKT